MDEINPYFIELNKTKHTFYKIFVISSLIFFEKRIILLIQTSNTSDRNKESNSLKTLEDDATSRLIAQ